MTQDRTTQWIDMATANTLRELSVRTGISQFDLMKLIFAEIQKQLDLMEAGKRLLFMCDLYTADNVPKTIVRLSDANTFGIPAELNRTEVERAFGYERDPKTGAIIDTIEKKKEVKKK